MRIDRAAWHQFADHWNRDGVRSLAVARRLDEKAGRQSAKWRSVPWCRKRIGPSVKKICQILPVISSRLNKVVR